ncbi:MAG: hypothetical protein M1839_007924 [Geoglossum umbratile]|nr:MAG: hypothetical protein M1839_007924 [Geoglossum umbratile]
MSSGSSQTRNSPTQILAALSDNGLYIRQLALQVQYVNNMDEAADPDLVITPFDRRSPQGAGILDLSGELLAEIGSYLPAFWLLQLCSTCRAMNDLFGFKRNNVIWYNALPPALWLTGERFQNEEELKVHILAKQFPSSMMRVWFPFHYLYELSPLADPKATAVAVPPHSGAFLSAGFSAMPQIPYTGTKWALYHPPSGSVQAHAYVGKASEPDFVASRACKTLLGSKYDSNFNYRREIIGTLAELNVCFVCFRTRNTDGSPVRASSWKLRLCDTCWEAYSVVGSVVNRIAPVLKPYLRLLENMDPLTGPRVRKYFQPQVNQAVLEITGYSWDTVYLMWQRTQQEKKNARLQSSPTEARRRAVRLKVVAAAEELWEGRDPFPAELVDPDTGSIQLITHLGTPDSTKYAAFRNRFAPTKKLRDFLFSPAALSDKPALLAYYSEGTWLADPTKQLHSVQQFSNVNTAWLSCNASLMLEKLTNWRHSKYSDDGMGGSVDSWREAVMSWHLTRLEWELESGAIYDALFITSVMAHARMDRHIIRLKTLLGYSGDSAQELPSLPERGTKMTPEQYEQYLRDEQSVRRAEYTERERQKVFNKLMRETCCCCPANGMVFYPMGLKGLCKHCLDCHPQLFWEEDFHCYG